MRNLMLPVLHSESAEVTDCEFCLCFAIAKVDVQFMALIIVFHLS